MHRNQKLSHESTRTIEGVRCATASHSSVKTTSAWKPLVLLGYLGTN